MFLLIPKNAAKPHGQSLPERSGRQNPPEQQTDEGGSENDGLKFWIILKTPAAIAQLVEHRLITQRSASRFWEVLFLFFWVRSLLSCSAAAEAEEEEPWIGSGPAAGSAASRGSHPQTGQEERGAQRDIKTRRVGWGAWPPDLCTPGAEIESREWGR